MGTGEREHPVRAVAGGVTVLIVAPEIPDNAPAAFREGLARRRLVSAGQRCPCGAALALSAPVGIAGAAGRVIYARVMHEDDCPAVSPALDEWLGP